MESGIDEGHEKEHCYDNVKGEAKIRSTWYVSDSEWRRRARERAEEMP